MQDLTMKASSGYEICPDEIVNQVDYNSCPLGCIILAAVRDKGVNHLTEAICHMVVPGSSSRKYSSMESVIFGKSRQHATSKDRVASLMKHDITT